MNKLPEAIILDLDDTIIADDALNQHTWKIVTEKYAPVIGISPQELLDKILAVKSAYWADPERNRRGRLQLYQTRREVTAQALIQFHLGDQKLGYEIGDAYSAEKERNINLLPGALETLERLRSLSIPLALLTNGESPLQRSKIERFQILHYFKFILIEGEFGCGKPEKQVFEACLERLDATPSSTWMVGDNLESDIGGAMRLGIKGIWIDWQQRGLPSTSSVKPDRIVHRLAELLAERDKIR
jgi:putative hydrolase of the HAD superfamily